MNGQNSIEGLVAVGETVLAVGGDRPDARNLLAQGACEFLTELDGVVLLDGEVFVAGMPPQPRADLKSTASGRRPADRILVIEPLDPSMP